MTPYLQHSQSSSVSGSSVRTTRRCSSQIDRRAERDGNLRPEAHDRADAYEVPNKAPKAATDILERSRTAPSMATASRPVGSERRETRSVSAPPEANRVSPAAESSMSDTRYGNVESSRRIVIAPSSTARGEERALVVDVVGPAASIEGLQLALARFAFRPPSGGLPVSCDVLWAVLDAFGVWLAKGDSGRAQIGRLRAFAGLLGEGNRRAILILKEFHHD